MFLFLCLVLLFSPFLFHIFLFLLDSSIHLSYSDASVRFVSRTFLFSLLILFSLVLSHLYRVFSSTFPSLSCFIFSPIFLRASLFLSLSVLSLLFFVLCISPRLFFPFLCFRFCVFYLILLFISFLTCSVIHFLFFSSFFSFFILTSLSGVFSADYFIISFIVIISISSFLSFFLSITFYSCSFYPVIVCISILFLVFPSFVCFFLFLGLVSRYNGRTDHTFLFFRHFLV